MVLEHNEYKNSLTKDQIDEDTAEVRYTNIGSEIQRDTRTKTGRFKERKKPVNLHHFCINQLQPKFLQFHQKFHSHVLRNNTHTIDIVILKTND